SGFPTGVKALLFEEAAARRRYEDEAVQLLLEAGFGEVVLPILDYFEPYEALVPPQAREELYRFVDRDGELLALRGDFTPMLARVLAPRLESLQMPMRVFYRGDRVRYQEERVGRLREYYELGGELLGVPGPEADAETLELVLRLLLLRPGARLRVVLGFAGALDGLLRELAAGERAEVLRAVATRDRRRARAVGPTVLEIVESGAPASPGALGDEAAARLEELVALCTEVAGRVDGDRVDLTVDLAEFAEDTLDPEVAAATGTTPYYDGFVFRAYADDTALSAGRGGRYDRLFRRLGADLPAVGFSISPDRLLGRRSR
ncbi:MAG: ATP phosphoribosyltransferase regulatory subunit, partial [Thermoanaerobaculia bacterium]|nr:ATP phosphoribosyltransferase regulatory subunit [Thermoanaerobaculia bacterium]